MSLYVPRAAIEPLVIRFADNEENPKNKKDVLDAGDIFHACGTTVRVTEDHLSSPQKLTHLLQGVANGCSKILGEKWMQVAQDENQLYIAGVKGEGASFSESAEWFFSVVTSRDVEVKVYRGNVPNKKIDLSSRTVPSSRCKREDDHCQLAYQKYKEATQLCANLIASFETQEGDFIQDVKSGQISREALRDFLQVTQGHQECIQKREQAWKTYQAKLPSIR